VDGTQLGSDGNLWRAYSDNDDRDVTPRVQGQKYYTFGLGQQKYKLFVQANGSILFKDHIVPAANYCVGQQISFAPAWNPPLPETPQESPVLWGLGGTYVNTNTPSPNSDGCQDFYVNNPVYLQSKTTCAWWVDGQYSPEMLTATFDEGLTFANGQYVNIATSGKFTMHKPRLINYTNKINPANTNLLAALGAASDFDDSHIAVSINHFKHAPGDTPIYDACGNSVDDIEVNPPAFFSVQVDSLFGGASGTTQLISGSSGNACHQDTFNTEADGSELYAGWSFNIIPGNFSGYNSMVVLYDTPHQPANGGSASMQYNFQDYIRFKPTAGPGQNIFVTIGIVNWHAHGTTTLLIIPGTTNQDYAPILTSSSPDIMPVFDNDAQIDSGPTSSDVFPNWSHTSQAGNSLCAGPCSFY
jgi:hypothetical protein